MPTSGKNKIKLTERQTDGLKILKRAPKTTTQAFEQLNKKNKNVTKKAVHGCMRNLENRGLVRTREKYDRKLKRNLIVWELTASGRKALDK